jgi:hypothetical protein
LGQDLCVQAPGRSGAVAEGEFLGGGQLWPALAPILLPGQQIAAADQHYPPLEPPLPAQGLLEFAAQPRRHPFHVANLFQRTPDF